MRISDWSSDGCSSDLPICIGIIINFTKGDPLIRCPLLGQTKSGYPLGHTSPTIIAQMLTFVEHHPVGLFLWCQAQALLSHLLAAFEAQLIILDGSGQRMVAQPHLR